MEKNEILKKARAEAHGGADEMEVQVSRRGYELALIIGGLLFIAVMLVQQVQGQYRYDLGFLYFSMVFIKFFYTWYRLRKKSMLMWAILFGASAVWDLWRYVTFLLG